VKFDYFSQREVFIGGNKGKWLLKGLLTLFMREKKKTMNYESLVERF